MTGALPVKISTLVIVAIVLAVVGYLWFGPQALGVLLLPFLGSSKKKLVEQSKGKTELSDQQEQYYSDQVVKDIAAVNEAHEEAEDAAKDTKPADPKPGFKPRTYRSE